MNPNPIANDARRGTRQRRLPAEAVCLLCGIANPAVLRTSILDEHHPLSRRIAPDLTVVLCRNCHDLVHEDLRDHGVDLRQPAGSILEQIVLLLTAAGTFLAHLGHTLTEWARALNQLIPALDQAHPGWRALPEATR